MTRGVYVEEAGPVRFVDTAAAAKYLALDAHTLEYYRAERTLFSFVIHHNHGLSLVSGWRVWLPDGQHGFRSPISRY